MTIYDSDLVRLAGERNTAYETLSEIDSFARGLLEGDHAAVGEHLLKIMYGE